MPPKESIERVRRWHIGAGIFAALMMCATSGTKYITYAGVLMMLLAWFAMGYVQKAILSFSRYVRTNYPEFYHREELTGNGRRYWFSMNATVQVWPYKSWWRDEQGKGVRQKIIDLIPDKNYIESLEALQKYGNTAGAIAAINFGALILFSILKLWA